MTRRTAAMIGVLGAGLAACSASPAAESPPSPPSPSSPTTIGASPADPVPSPTCVSGVVLVNATPVVQGQYVCLHVGGALQITFDKSGPQMGVPGPWIGSPVVTPTSMLEWGSEHRTGNTMVVHVTGKRPATGTVTVFWDVGCSGPQATPCTVPPQGSMSIHVRVVP